LLIVHAYIEITDPFGAPDMAEAVSRLADPDAMVEIEAIAVIGYGCVSNTTTPSHALVWDRTHGMLDLNRLVSRTECRLWHQ
jgi:hypothetical protein